MYPFHYEREEISKIENYFIESMKRNFIVLSSLFIILSKDDKTIKLGFKDSINCFHSLRSLCVQYIYIYIYTGCQLSPGTAKYFEN